MPKKSKKNNKNGKKKTDTLSAPPDKKYYETIIAELNTKLMKLRVEIVSLEKNYVNISDELSVLKADRLDVADHLKRRLECQNSVIVLLKDRLFEVVNLRNKEKVEADVKMVTLQAQYNSTYGYFMSEMKLLNGKLVSLDEFRIKRDLLLSNFSNQELELNEKERLHKEHLFKIQQQLVIENDGLKKEVEIKLLQVSDDFTKSSEIRNAGYTRRLIRENITLQREIHRVIDKQIRYQTIYNHQLIQNREIDEEFAAMEQIRDHLIAVGGNQLDIVNKLTMAYEQIQCKYMEVLKFRKLYDTHFRKKICRRFTNLTNTKKLSMLDEKLKMLLSESKHLIYIRSCLDYEVKHLNEIVNDIKVAVTGTLENVEIQQFSMMDANALNMLKRKTVLTRLMEVIGSHSEKLSNASTLDKKYLNVYQQGSLGFIDKQRKSFLLSNEEILTF